jgi:signal transduction histidine kinase
MFGLHMLEQEAHHPEQVVARVAELKQMTDSVSENLHRLAMDLRPASLDHIGLAAALLQYTKTLGERTHLKVQFKTVGFDGERLPPAIETALYRIVQEALTNVVRHAQATRVDVILELRAARVAALVEDNGVGFDPEAALSAQGGRLGLLGVRERAETLGGTLEIESAAGMGTTVVVEVPL